MSRSFKTSEALFEKAKTYFPGGVNSPVRAFKSVGGTPLFFKKGKGARVWDEDGHEYLDFCGSWGPLILGHAPDTVLEALQQTMQNGTSFGAPTALENQLAEIILQNHSCLEKIRFVSSGTEAVMSALRLARGLTGRSKIIKFDGCFHGHVDSMLVNAGSGLATLGIASSQGVPASIAQETIVLPLNNIPALDAVLAKQANEVACIIIEPIPANNGLLLQDKSFLTHLRQVCDKHGIILLFDEVISGFRVGFEGAAGYYGIKPDLMTFGKVIGGGLPVGAYGGSAQSMSLIAPEGAVYQAGTLSGNPMAMAAGIAQLKTCLQPGFYESLNAKTNQLVQGVMSHVQSKGYDFYMYHVGSIFWMSFQNKQVVHASAEIKSESMQYFKKMYHYLLQQGIYFGPSGYEVGFISAAHTKQDIQEATQKINQALDFVFA